MPISNPILSPGPVLAHDADPESDLPPLLLLHGLLSSRRHWLPNAALSRRFRLIRAELPGHGASPAPLRPEEARPGAIAAALEALRVRLGIARWHICGQSFGAGISLRYALANPDRCLSHVFTNANAALRASWPDEARAGHEALIARIRAEGQAAIRTMPYHPVHARRFPPELRAMLAADIDAVDPQGIALLLQEASPNLSVRNRLSELKVPTLLVNGMRERRFQPLRDWLAEAHPEIAIVDLDGGHSINVECPEGFDAAVCDFAGAEAP